MNRKFVIVIILFAGLTAAGLSVAQQKRPYDQVMKEIQTTFASLRKNLDASAVAAVVEDATKLEGLFAETHAFWTPFKTKDALDAAKAGKDASAAVAAAARNNDVKKAQGAYNGIAKNCTGCHNSHREQMPDKSYRIKP